MNDCRELVLDAYMDAETDSGRFTSQDICDNLKDTVRLSPDEVTEYLIKRGYTLQRDDDRLVWVSI